MDERATNSRFPISARLNLLIIGLQLLAMFAIFYGTAEATHLWQIGILAVAFGIVGNSVYAIVHEAEHRILHSNRKLNDLLGVVMAMFFPAPFHLLRQGHLGHHLRNRSDDEAFDFYFDGDHPVLKYLQLYGILTGVYWLTVVLSSAVVLICPGVLRRSVFEFDRPSAALMDSFNPAYWPLIKMEAAMVIGMHTLIVWGMGIPLMNYALVYFGFGFSWSAMQYVHHFGTERHALRGARNLRLFGAIDLLWLNHNWHLTHHKHPTVPWIHLPRLGRTEDGGRGFLPWHYLRMWCGPRYSDEHVENKYAGRIIR